MSGTIPPAEVIALRVAGLGLRLDARGSGIRMAAPACHARFLAAGPPNDGLVVQVRNGGPPTKEGWRPLCRPPQKCEVWQDIRGRYVFVAPSVCPPARYAVVDAGFKAGEVIGDFSGNGDETPAAYPLLNIEILIFANWLACFGDPILHAVGVDLAGAGYCFAGAGGAGKSTLAAALSASSEVTVLGEDQVVLRYLDGRFSICGTPWHQNPAMCSPRAAPLEKLFFLERVGVDAVAPCSPLDGVTRLLQTAFIPYYRPDAMSAILGRLAILAERVQFYTLSYRLGTDVLRLIRGL